MKIPYLPEGREILYVEADHAFLQEARLYAEEHSSDHLHPTGAVIVRENEVLGRGANVSHYHEDHGCRRKELNIPTGEGYELCKGCSPKNHAEQAAIADAQTRHSQEKIAEADLYLWGHWWCCESCWDCIIKSGLKNVYLVEEAFTYFGRPS